MAEQEEMTPMTVDEFSHAVAEMISRFADANDCSHLVWVMYVQHAEVGEPSPTGSMIMSNLVHHEDEKLLLQHAATSIDVNGQRFTVELDRAI